MRVFHTVSGMTAPSSPAAKADRPAGQHDLVTDTDVLAAVAGALHAGAARTPQSLVQTSAARTDRDDWAVLEAWVAAVTLINWAALRAVPAELHDFL